MDNQFRFALVFKEGHCRKDILTGHVVMAVIGGLVLLAVANACVRALHARRVRGEVGTEGD